MRAALAWQAAAALPGDPAQPPRRLLRHRLLPRGEGEADDGRDGAGVAEIPAAVLPAAASELAQRAVDAAEPVVRSGSAARAASARAGAVGRSWQAPSPPTPPLPLEGGGGSGMTRLLPPPPRRQGNRIWRQHVFSPLPSGRGGDPSPRRWEGEGELPPPVSVRRQHESGSSPSPSRACGAGPSLSPLGRGGAQRVRHMRLPCPQAGRGKEDGALPKSLPPCGGG